MEFLTAVIADITDKYGQGQQMDHQMLNKRHPQTKFWRRLLDCSSMFVCSCRHKEDWKIDHHIEVKLKCVRVHNCGEHSSSKYSKKLQFGGPSPVRFCNNFDVAVKKTIVRLQIKV